MSETREIAFRRNEALEGLLHELNEDLACAERELVSRQHLDERCWPVVLVMGCLRSGTTLMMQWLANSGMVCYPTNLLSRFYAAPIVGAKVQLLLTDPRYGFRNELFDLSSSVGYESENGKTVGALAPNEFWYFWRQFLAEPERDVWSNDDLAASLDAARMSAELNGISSVFGRPFAAKGMLFNYNIATLDRVLKRVVFLRIKREFVANTASILDARRRQLGDEHRWYSFKIPEYEWLRNRSPVEQAAGQVVFINEALDRGLSTVDHSRKIEVEYERFCESPGEVYEQLKERLEIEDDGAYSGPERFEVRHRRSGARRAEIDGALEEVRRVGGAEVQ